MAANIRIAIVTGATSPLGGSVTREFLAQGIHVMGTYRSEDSVADCAPNWVRWRPIPVAQGGHNGRIRRQGAVRDRQGRAWPGGHPGQHRRRLWRRPGGLEHPGGGMGQHDSRQPPLGLPLLPGRPADDDRAELWQDRQHLRTTGFGEEDTGPSQGPTRYRRPGYWSSPRPSPRRSRSWT